MRSVFRSCGSEEVSIMVVDTPDGALIVNAGSVGWILVGRKWSFTRQVMRELLPVPEGVS